MKFVSCSVTPQGAVATLTELLRARRKSFEVVTNEILQLLNKTRCSEDPVTLVSVTELDKQSSAANTNGGDASTIPTSVQYISVNSSEISTSLSSQATLQEISISLPVNVFQSFHEQRSKIIDLELQKEQETERLATQLLPILHSVAHYSEEFQGWGHPNLSSKNILLTAISGAMTNTIYKVEFQQATESGPTVTSVASTNNEMKEGKSEDVSIATVDTSSAHAILVRLYGEGTESFFNRDDELRTFSNLSSLKYGAHALLCQFENGRCERFFTGSRPLTASEFTQENWSNIAMGKEVFVFHQLKMFEEPNMSMPTYEQAVSDFLNTVKCCYSDLLERSNATWFACNQSNDGGNKSSNSNGCQILRSEDERKWLHDTIYSSIPEWLKIVECSLLNETNSVVARSKNNVVFGHNDLQPGNILVNESNMKITFIDFEYARYVPRGYDIINLWCEWAADYHGDTPHLMNYNNFPTTERTSSYFIK
jgi:thiamine kinase-like enzyme